MPNDNDMTRLLYAILSQKCLKDIDWNKVANDPILAQRITNGHAARMRYSRFKKQMDGTATIRRPRNSNPNRKKPEKKSKDKKIKQRLGSDNEEEVKVKLEIGRDSETPGPQMGNLPSMSPEHPFAKAESSMSSYSMATPSPTPGYDGGPESMAAQHMNDMSSFGNYELSNSVPTMYQPQNFEMGGIGGIGGNMGMAGQFNMWQHQSQPPQCNGFVTGAETAPGILVKQEERWEDGYQH